ncbi:MAG: hypothetical protein OSA98_19355 [Rubripirellula sp.]|nr:hypothetical protein [Rubripirellula sp.]
MRRKRTRKRRLTVQSLENRRLFAADVGVTSCSLEMECKVLPLVGPANPSGTSDPGGSTYLTEQLGGSADPGGDDV